MANFDNGLPPTSADTSQCSIHSINIENKPASQADSDSISHVIVSQKQTLESEVSWVSSVSINKKSSGKNIAMFL